MKTVAAGKSWDAFGRRLRKNALSSGITLVLFVLIGGVVAATFREAKNYSMLLNEKYIERTVNELLDGLRIYPDFEEVIKHNAELQKLVLGVGIYKSDKDKLYGYGIAPDVLPKVEAPGERFGNAIHQYYANRRNQSVVEVVNQIGSLPPPDPGMDLPMGEIKFYELLRQSRSIYIEISRPDYWNQAKTNDVLLPLIEVLLAFALFFFNRLVIRNKEYRDTLAQQENLVILGTAASTIAHELKNPLLSIKLQTRVIEKTCPETHAEEIETIIRQVDRLSALSLRVGDYLRDPSGNAMIIDPFAIAVEVGQRLIGRTIVHKAGGEEIRVFMDPEKLRSVLENLVRNAIEASPDDSLVAMEISGMDGKACIEVLDRGSGIPDKDRTRVFEPFFTTKSRGMGIGLSICDRFVKAAGGTLSLDNRAGGGCLAKVLLPKAGVYE